MILLIFSSIFIIFIPWLLWTIWSRIKTCDKKRVCIVVLGDIGRSPRMQYHALSFMNEGYFVDIVGYSGSEPLEELINSPKVNIHYLTDVPEWNNQIPRLLSYIIKTLWQSVHLARILFIKIQSSYLMIQNPPAIPTIPICWCYCRIFQVQFIIDWHNYAYSIMALTIGREHPLVKITMFIESFFGKRADKNFCVTNAMKNDLNSRWSIEATVLYDRPPLAFKPIDLSEKHSLLIRLSKTYEEFRNGEEGSSVLTECLANGEIQLRKQRPALIVSSTSWTEDEDFSVLFTALKEYEMACCNENSMLPNLICAITGKGPLKDFWTAIIKFKQWKHVKIITPWLSNEDYPKLLASADLGICLHTSTSGLDLPMKVVDMFGCGLPVCALNFNCLDELVRHEENSLVFSNDQELSTQLKTWFFNFPNNQQQIDKNKKFRQELENFQNLRWAARSPLEYNDRPIIGIVAQEASHHLRHIYNNAYSSYIAASYVKYIESAGARVVPIRLGRSRSYYEDIMSKVNGVVFPGGSTNFTTRNGFFDTVGIIYRIATRMNEQGDYIPLWGTCLGFEAMTYVAAGDVDVRVECTGGNNVALPLNFTNSFNESKLFKHAPKGIINILKNEPVTANFHKLCVTKKKLKEVNLSNTYHVLTVNYDDNGLRYISTMEHFNMPFYATQFHPEKNSFEWATRLKGIPHSKNAIRVGQYFANFFVDEARKNFHTFVSKEEEISTLIYNYPTTYTGPTRSSFEQCYLFKDN